MNDELWKLEVSKFMGTIRNELENNRISHEKVSDCLHEVKDVLADLPCGTHTTDIAVLKNKFSKPYLIGILVIALIPAMFLFLKFRDLKVDYTKEAQALQKTQVIFEKFIEKNGHLLEIDDDLRLINKEGGKEGDK